MKRWWGAAGLAVGLLWMFFSAAGYLGTMLPYPDPRPEDLAFQASELVFWRWAFFVGLGIALGGAACAWLPIGARCGHRKPPA